jgi:hypothetical protein
VLFNNGVVLSNIILKLPIKYKTARFAPLLENWPAIYYQ